MVLFDNVVTAMGSPNIAFVKYWGKRDEKLILPYNSNISMTLSQDVLHTTTSLLFSKKLAGDTLVIDGEKQNLENKDVKERLWILNKLREMAHTDAKVMIVSKNDFPAASGLASSASGIATLVYAANEALELKLPPRELSIIARQGSGSACRSIFGGMVIWHKGNTPDGTDSYAEQVFDERYWPGIVDIIAITSQKRKKTSSRAGMRQTVETNPLYGSRPKAAERRVQEVIDSYHNRDFNRLAEHIMADSNEMHALMISTRPSIRYLNGVSFEIMDMIEGLNAKSGSNIAAYTFDAGPNAHIITLKDHEKDVLSALEPLISRNEVLEVRSAAAGGGPRILKDVSLIDEKPGLKARKTKGN
jgi:diphosphomevalonate decarboxylase